MELKPHQIEAVQRIKDEYQVLLCDDMGLGKTATALKGIEDRLKEGRYLVVCPASLKLNWCHEIAVWLDTQIEPDNFFDYPIAVTNYERLKSNFLAIRKAGFIGVIFDEAHYMKNNESDRGFYGIKIGWMFPYRMLLTGTPMLSGPKDLAPLLDCMGLINEFGGYTDFYKRYCIKVNNGYGIGYDGSKHVRELNNRLKKWMIRRTKKEVGLELPPKQIIRIPVCKLSQPYASTFHEMEESQRIVNITKMPYALDFLNNLLEQGKRPVVFVHHRDVMNELRSVYGKAGYIVGGQSPRSRDKHVADFQQGKTDMIICSLQASSVGITLTSSDTAVFLEYLWSPSVHDQARDRIHRITQKKPVTIYELYCAGSIEDQKDYNAFCKQLDMRDIL